MSEIMMASTMADDVPRFARAAIDSLSAEDFETASVRSIRSAAPSYTSDAPSYHSTNPHPDPLPAYSPPAARSTPAATAPPPPRNGSVSSLLDLEPSTSSSSSSTTTTPRRYGLPPIPTGPPRRQPDLPSLSQFRAPSWSPATASGAGGSNPTARLYQNVALRRAQSAAHNTNTNSSGTGAGAAGPAGTNLDVLMRRMVLERIEEEERNRTRPLEDPYLVGEEAAARARAERMERERVSGEEILIREDRRWDCFLAQMKDREERERSWKRFRRDVDKRSNSRLPFRIGARF